MDPNDQRFRLTKDANSKKKAADQQQDEDVFSQDQPSPFIEFQTTLSSKLGSKEKTTTQACGLSEQ